MLPVQPCLHKAAFSFLESSHPWWEEGHWRQAVYVGRIAGLRRAQGRYNEAKKIYDDLLQANRESFDLMKELGITYTLEGNLKEA
jgi:hypothetical protein